MVINLPVERVDEFTTFNLLNTGHVRTVETGIIVYRHSQGGTIALRKLDDHSTEVMFSYPYYPSESEVLPIYYYSKLETARIFGKEDEYSEYAKEKQNEEYNRRLSAKQALVNDLCQRFKQEEMRLREKASAPSNNEVLGNSKAGEVKIEEGSRVQKTPQQNYSQLSDDEKLCLAWVNRPAYPYQNMERFLSEAGSDLSLPQFKRMLKEYGKKGLIKKWGKKWVSNLD